MNQRLLIDFFQQHKNLYNVEYCEGCSRMLTRGTDGSEEHWTREIPRLGKRGESLSGSVVARIYEGGGGRECEGVDGV